MFHSSSFYLVVDVFALLSQQILSPGWYILIMADTSGDAGMASTNPITDSEGGTSVTTTTSQPGKGTLKSLAEMAEQRLLNDLAASLNSYAQSATFARGGSLPFATNEAANEQDSSAKRLMEGEVQKTSPIRIRFGESGKASISPYQTPNTTSKEFQELLSACQPASSARGSEAILDEDYHKAAELDSDAFDTKLCPYRAGIVDVVAQLLLSQTGHKKHMQSIRVCGDA
jgi:hypothetical protein